MARQIKQCTWTDQVFAPWRAVHQELHLAALLSGREDILRLGNALETALEVLYT